MLPALKQIWNNHPSYTPILSEIEGVSCIILGSAALGCRIVLKVAEFYEGKKHGIPYITNDAARFDAEIGLGAIGYGIKQLMPLTGVILAVYMLKSDYI